MITLYNVSVSGNCHKVRLLLNFLNLPYEIQDIDLASLEPDFLELNHFGQVPVLKDDEVVIRDSQAILVYLAKRYGGAQWWPNNAVTLAQITAWLSTAANEIAHGPATLRFHYKFGRSINKDETRKATEKVLNIINQHLSKQDWLVDESLSIADLAVYPYIALVHEGKFDIQPYQYICSWMKRLEQQAEFITMPGIKP